MSIYPKPNINDIYNPDDYMTLDEKDALTKSTEVDANDHSQYLHRAGGTMTGQILLPTLQFYDSTTQTSAFTSALKTKVTQTDTDVVALKQNITSTADSLSLRSSATRPIYTNSMGLHMSNSTSFCGFVGPIVPSSDTMYLQAANILQLSCGVNSNITLWAKNINLGNGQCNFNLGNNSYLKMNGEFQYSAYTAADRTKLQAITIPSIDPFVCTRLEVGGQLQTSAFTPSDRTKLDSLTVQPSTDPFVCTRLQVGGQLQTSAFTPSDRTKLDSLTVQPSINPFVCTQLQVGGQLQSHAFTPADRTKLDAIVVTSGIPTSNTTVLGITFADTTSQSTAFTNTNQTELAGLINNITSTSTSLSLRSSATLPIYLNSLGLHMSSAAGFVGSIGAIVPGSAKMYVNSSDDLVVGSGVGKSVTMWTNIVNMGTDSLTLNLGNTSKIVMNNSEQNFPYTNSNRDSVIAISGYGLTSNSSDLICSKNVYVPRLYIQNAESVAYTAANRDSVDSLAGYGLTSTSSELISSKNLKVPQISFTSDGTVQSTAYIKPPAKIFGTTALGWSVFSRSASFPYSASEINTAGYEWHVRSPAACFDQSVNGATWLLGARLINILFEMNAKLEDCQITMLKSQILVKNGSTIIAQSLWHGWDLKSWISTHKTYSYAVDLTVMMQTGYKVYIVTKWQIQTATAASPAFGCSSQYTITENQ